MPTVNLKNIQGATVGQVELSDELFAAEVNPFAMHLVVRAILNGAADGVAGLATVNDQHEYLAGLRLTNG